MANVKWIGAADAVAQVGTIQITAYDAATTYIITIGTDTVSVLGDTDVNTTASNLQVALEASTNPYFSAIDWTVSTDTITATGGTAGVPFTATSSVSGGTGTIGAYSATTAATGPNFWSDARNWDTGSTPSSSDSVVIEKSSVSIAYGLDQSSVTLAELIIRKDFTGRIGLKEKEFSTSADGGTTNTTKNEYRDQYLQIGATILSIGENFTNRPQTGSQLVKIDLGSVQSEVTVHETASTAFEASKPAIQLLGSNASNELFVRAARASVGVAVGGFETATFSEIQVGSDMSVGGVELGSGTTVTTFGCKSGTHYINATANITTLDALGGTVTTEGEGYLITTVTVGGGVSYFPNHTNSGGVEITTLTYQDDATVDTTTSSKDRTFTTVNLVGGAVFVADKTQLTVTNMVFPSELYEIELS
jgi:hypothetical protein